MIQIYSAENKDYDHNGDMTLLPEECSVHVVLNGEWTATLEHPIEDGNISMTMQLLRCHHSMANSCSVLKIKKKEIQE